MLMREPFTVGVVIAASDLYTNAIQKAVSKLDLLERKSPSAAAAFRDSFHR